MGAKQSCPACPAQKECPPPPTCPAQKECPPPPTCPAQKECPPPPDCPACPAQKECPPPPVCPPQQPIVGGMRYMYGYITNVQEVYATGPGVVTTNSFPVAISQIIRHFKDRDIVAPNANYISLWNDGCFRLYDIPPGTDIVTDNNPAISTYSLIEDNKSTFGSVSYFGKGGCGMMIILIILLILAGAYFLHTQGKLKMPTFKQRIAQFGRTIKSLRKMRG